jgi:copper transport protein
VVIVLLGVLGTLGMTGSAAAANTLVSSQPAEGEALPASPTQMVLVFAEPLGTQNTAAVTCGGTPVSVGSPSVGPDTKTLTIAVPIALPTGSCELRWSVSAPEGGSNGSGKVAFSVAAGGAPNAATAALPGSSTTIAGDTPPTTALVAAVSTTNGASGGGSQGPAGLARLIATIGLAVLFGSLVVIALAWPEGVEYILTVRFLRSAWVVAVVGSYLHVVALGTLLTDASLGKALLPTSWVDLADSCPGLAAIVRFLFAAGSAWVIARPERVIDQVTQLAALAIPGIAVATFGFSRSEGDLVPIGYAAGVAHALAMAVWVGGLVLLTRVVLAGPGEEDLVHAVRGFSRISTPAIVVTVLSGAVQLYRLDGRALFSTGHGRVVLLKVLITVGVVFIGARARQVIHDRLSRADSLGQKMAVRLRRSLGAEALACVVVLLLSAWLLALKPATADSASAANLGDEQVFKSTDDTIEVTVAFTQRVGLNAVRVEVVKPPEGLASGATITFVPEAELGGTGVQFFVPPVAGPGAFYLPIDDGMPLDVPGRWTVSVVVNGATVASKSVTVDGEALAATETTAP